MQQREIHTLIIVSTIYISRP